MSKKLELDLGEEEVSLTVNKDYARNYEQWRKKEELQKCRFLNGF